MEGISSFLERFKGLLFSASETRRILAEEILKLTGVSIPPESIDIKETKAHIKTSPLIRGEILMNKEKILQAVKEKTSKEYIKDIV